MSLEPGHKIGAKQTDPLLAKSVGQLLSSLGAKSWDVLIVTDGSGQRLDKAGGFSSLLVMRRTANYLLFHGQVSNCSSQEAEVRAIFEGVNALVRMGLHLRLRGVRAHILTDSEQCATQLAKTDPLAVAATKHHPLLWAGIRQAARLGIQLNPHHLPRNSNPLMTLMDTIAGANRKAMISQLMGTTYTEWEPEVTEKFPMTIPQR